MAKMQTWEKTNILNRIQQLEIRVDMMEDQIKDIIQLIVPEDIESVITTADLIQIDEILEETKRKGQGQEGTEAI